MNGQVGDYVDVRGTDMQWKGGQVVAVDPVKGLRVQYLRSGEAFAEWLDRESSRLALYRVRTKCTGEVDLPAVTLTAQLLTSICNRLATDYATFPPPLSPKDLIGFYRGDLYNVCCTLLTKEPRSQEELETGLNLLMGVTGITMKWLIKVPEMYSHVLLLQSTPEILYTAPELAVASIWPEMMQILALMLGVASFPLRFLSVVFT